VPLIFFDKMASALVGTYLRRVLIPSRSSAPSRSLTRPFPSGTGSVAAWQSGALSQDSMLDLFRRGEILPEGRTNEEEVRLVGVGRTFTGGGILRATGRAFL